MYKVAVRTREEEVLIFHNTHGAYVQDGFISVHFDDHAYGPRKCFNANRVTSYEVEIDKESK